MGWVYLVVLLVILVILIEVGKLAVQYWIPSLFTVAAISIIYFATRIRDLPRSIPSSTLGRAVPLPKFADLVIENAKPFIKKAEAYRNATSLQLRKLKDPEKEFNKYKERKLYGTPISTEGTVTNVTRDHRGFVVSVAPKTSQEVVGDTIDAYFSSRWKKALLKLNAGSEVQLVGSLEEWEAIKVSYTEKVLEADGDNYRWADDYRSYNKDSFLLKGHSIALIG